MVLYLVFSTGKLSVCLTCTSKTNFVSVIQKNSNAVWVLNSRLNWCYRCNKFEVNCNSHWFSPLWFQINLHFYNWGGFFALYDIIYNAFTTAFDEHQTCIIIRISFRFRPNSPEFLSYYYYPTHTRMAPYLIGMLVGYSIYTLKFKRKRVTLPRVCTAVLKPKLPVHIKYLAGFCNSVLDTCIYNNDTLYIWRT